LANQQRLLEYVKAGGTLVVQYQGFEAEQFRGGGDSRKFWRSALGHIRSSWGGTSVTEEKRRRSNFRIREMPAAA